MKRILFVDDEPKLLDGLRRMLRPRRAEWTMEFASSGPDALDRMAAGPFDVVVSDMRMPGMDGPEFLARVVGLHPATVRIVLSGQCHQQTVLDAVGPAHQFLTKPCDPATLQAEIDRVCRLRDRVGDRWSQEFVSQMTAMPCPESACSALDAELRAPEPSIERAGRIVAGDVGLAAKVLQLVSSGFFGPPQKAVAPATAVSMLGIEVLKSLAGPTAAFQPLPENESLTLCCREATGHSLRVAGGARRIAQAEGASPATVTHAFVAGLLHDVGLLVLARLLLQDAGEGRVSEGDALSAWECENRTAPRHAEVGGYLLGLWGLPDAIVDAAAFHHQPGLSGDRQFTPLAAVHVANAVDRQEDASLKERKAALGDAPQVDQDYLDRVGCRGRFEAWREMVLTGARETVTA